jgi:hypothetical protein
MKISRRAILIWVGVPLSILIGAIALGLIFRGEYETQQAVTRTFTIDANFTDVRKILVRTDGAKQIITMAGDSKFLEQSWSAVGVDLDADQQEDSSSAAEADKADPAPLLQMMLNPQWKLELHGTLKVQSLDEYIGKPEVQLKQDVEIQPDYLNSQVDLEKPTARLKGYLMTTRFERDADNKETVVKLSLKQKILTDAPWFAHRIADRRVRASASKALENQERAIRQLIADNIKDVPMFPLR